MKQPPISAEAVPASKKKSVYPPPFAEQVAGRTKRKLGDFFALSNFGVNLTHLAPGAVSALLHHHSEQDEFIYVLEGTPTLLLDEQAFVMKPGDCYGFKAGSGVAHQLVNRSAQSVIYLEVGDRSAGDVAEYPDDDLKATLAEGGTWLITHKDGQPY